MQPQSICLSKVAVTEENLEFLHSFPFLTIAYTSRPFFVMSRAPSPAFEREALTIVLTWKLRPSALAWLGMTRAESAAGYRCLQQKRF
jgi:hypothetical protein